MRHKTQDEEKRKIEALNLKYEIADGYAIQGFASCSEIANAHSAFETEEGVHG